MDYARHEPAHGERHGAERAWRALKASGAAVLRDGVYLMPERETCRAILDALARVYAKAAAARMCCGWRSPATPISRAVHRSADFAALLAEVTQTRE